MIIINSTQPLNTKCTTTYDFGNLEHGLGQVQECGGCKYRHTFQFIQLKGIRRINVLFDKNINYYKSKIFFKNQQNRPVFNQTCYCSTKRQQCGLIYMDFRIQTMFGSSLPQLFVGEVMSYIRYLCLFANSVVQHILCCVLLYLSSSGVPYVAGLSGLSIFDGSLWYSLTFME